MPLNIITSTHYHNLQLRMLHISRVFSFSSFKSEIFHSGSFSHWYTSFSGTWSKSCNDSIKSISRLQLLESTLGVGPLLLQSTQEWRHRTLRKVFFNKDYQEIGYCLEDFGNQSYFNRPSIQQHSKNILVSILSYWIASRHNFFETTVLCYKLFRNFIVYTLVLKYTKFYCVKIQGLMNFPKMACQTYIFKWTKTQPVGIYQQVFTILRHL